MLDAVQCGAAIVDEHGVIQRANLRLGDLVGRGRAALIGASFATLFCEEAQKRIGRLLSPGEAEGAETEASVTGPDGEPIPLTVAVRSMAGSADNGGGRWRMMTVISIARLRQAHAHLSQLTDTVLNQALELKHRNEDLETRVAERTAELHEANMQSIHMLAIASEARDADTGNHVQRINRYARAVAEALGVAGEEAERIGYSAVLHDVGKIEVPDEILKKPGPLTDMERQRMQRHTVVGEAILSSTSFFDLARQIARSHHENWDGSGYPDGAAGEAVPLAARIVHVVDVYDALLSPRVYKSAWDEDRAVALIRDQREKQFDPAVVDAFVELIDRGHITAVRDTLPVVVEA